MKKFLTCLFCLLLGLAQISYAADIFTDYDFSDEAQAEFDRTHKTTPATPVNNTEDPAHKMQIKQERHIIKGKQDKNTEQPVEMEFERKNYVLPEVQGTKQPVYQGHIVTVPEGSVLNIRLQSGVSSGSLDVNDNITAALSEDWQYMGNLIAPAGSLVYGVVTDVNAAGYAYGGGGLEITFNRIMTPDGTTYDIATQPISLESESERAKNMTRDVLIGAGIGILAGLLGVAFSGGENFGRNMAVFGGIGAATGALRGAAQRGQDANIQADTPLQLILTQPVKVNVYQPL